MSVEEVTPVAPVAEVVKAEGSPVEAIKECTQLAGKILKQVEFYFSDANLPRDKFLQEKIKEKDGWVDLAVLVSFSRMKALSEDISVIADAVSKSAELLEVNEEKTAVRRRTALPESQETLMRSVYVKGFPESASLDELEAFFAGVSESVQAIRMRRHLDSKAFKGSVFVEFPSEEEAARVAALSLSYNETPLVVMSKAKYFEAKNEERLGRKNKTEAAKEERPFEYTKGCLLRIESVPEEVDHMKIKEALQDKLTVAFAGITDGACTVRCKEPISEEALQAVAEITIGEHQLKSRLATEEEEAAFYAQFQKDMQAARAAKRSRGGRGGRGGKRQRR